jgi:hypothetical protein
MKKLITVSALAVLSVLGMSATGAQLGGAMSADEAHRPGMVTQAQAAGTDVPGPNGMSGSGMTSGGMMQGMMGQGGARGGSMGMGMMGPGMPKMMVVMMDANGDGTVSLDEFQAMHARMFKAMDTNGDGKLSADEVTSFWGGLGSPNTK